MFRKEFLKSAGAALIGSTVAKSNRFRNPQAISPLKARRLEEGDTIGFIAPAGIVYDENEFVRMESIVTDMGYNVVFGDYVRNRHGYLAGDDNERASELNRFFADPDIDGIMAVRGGWGSNRILPLIDFRIIRNNPKFFCGFSDITSLHLSISRITGLVTFHGPNGTSDWTSFTRKHFTKVASGGGENFILANPDSETGEIHTITPGIASGKLVGGNLTLVSSLVGSYYLPDMDGCILFLEDIGEDVYKIDRMLSQLSLSGVLNQIKGFVFGKCSDCRIGTLTGFPLEQVLDHYLKPLSIPSFYGAMIGHEPDSFTVPVGIRAEMDAEKGEIRLLENAVC